MRPDPFHHLTIEFKTCKEWDNINNNNNNNNNNNRDNYLDLARELKKLWNMRVTVIPIVIGELGTIPQAL